MQDVRALEQGEIIAPAVGPSPASAPSSQQLSRHRGFSASRRSSWPSICHFDRRHLFHQSWFATVEIVSKTVVPIGFVGVVVSYCGKAGHDLSGDAFRHGERVPRAIAAFGSARWDRVNTRSTLTPAKSSRCQPPISCCTGLRADPRRTVMTRACARSTW